MLFSNFEKKTHFVAEVIVGVAVVVLEVVEVVVVGAKSSSKGRITSTFLSSSGLFWPFISAFLRGCLSLQNGLTARTIEGQSHTLVTGLNMRKGPQFLGVNRKPQQ